MCKILKVWLAGLILLTSCGPIDVREEKRVTSPDGKIDAVVIHKSGGGAAGYSFYELYMVPAEKVIDETDTRTIGISHTYVFDISWLEPRLLEVRYSEEASIWQFENSYFYQYESEWFADSTPYEIALKRVPKP